MTLKELRILKGLNQKECAEYLGMTVRNYQNYENSEDRVNTARFHAIYSRLQNYSFSMHTDFQYKSVPEFKTNVTFGSGLKDLSLKVKKYKKRDVFNSLKQYINEDIYGKLCILYGLRRTGKTTLLFQLLEELPLDKTVYIKMKINDNMSNLTKDLYTLHDLGYQYILIDEITLLDDFINTAAVISDIFCCMGIKVILSGTDSLCFNLASRNELYDRCVTVHTSYISFGEYYRLLGICSIDKYIEYGGTLKIENMSFDDPDLNNVDVSFRDDESTRKYIDTSISRNIQNALKNDHNGERLHELSELFYHNELTNVINRLVENMNHRFVLNVINERFKSNDLGSTKELLLHEKSRELSLALTNINVEEVTQRLKEIIDIKEKNECSVEVNESHITKIKYYLRELDLLDKYKVVYESGSSEDLYTFTQPGMRYSICKALVYALLQDKYFNSINEFDKNYIINKILEDVKGKMLEDIVLVELARKSKNKKVLKYCFLSGGEVDMIIYDCELNSCKLYEIKHSNKVIQNQTKYLLDENCCNTIQKKYGKIEGKYVLYRGEDCLVGDVQYLNVENFLINN